MTDRYLIIKNWICPKCKNNSNDCGKPVEGKVEIVSNAGCRKCNTVFQEEYKAIRFKNYAVGLERLIKLPPENEVLMHDIETQLELEKV